MTQRTSCRILSVLGVLGLALSLAVPVAGQGAGDVAEAPQALNANPPSSPVRLIFIHHSTGGNWLADPAENETNGGDLGRALMNNSYYVSATNYDWGPDGIGSMTDIGHWWVWFRGEGAATDMAALFAESGQSLGEFGGWPRLATKPPGENRIIMFKSCFPNSDLRGNPGDPPTVGDNPMRGEWAGAESYTVGNAKGIYNDILEFFATREDKLFVVVTAPPLQQSDTTSAAAANARALNNWLVNDWLDGYVPHNVAVFDLYTVLTSNGGNATTNDLGLTTGNHHRYRNGAIEHITNKGSNYSVYPSGEGDSHPTSAGGKKATGEFVSLLNIFYNCWNGDGGCPGHAQGCSLTCSASVVSISPSSGVAPATVTFTAGATPSNCTGSVTYDWSFGDGSAHSATQSPTHTYNTAGTYTWTMTATVGGVTCQKTGTVTVTSGCSLSCNAAAAPTAGAPPLAVTFTGSATPSNCTGSITYDWNYGDGSAHGTALSPTHTYSGAGTYAWTFTATAGGQSCVRSGVVTVSEGAEVFVYLVPSVAHSTGSAGTNWRSDVAVVARGDREATLQLAFYNYTTGAATSVTRTLDLDATVEYVDILASELGFAQDSSVNGTLQITSDEPLVVASRTYNQETPTRTYGQYYPARIVEYPGGRGVDSIAAGDTGILAGLKKGSAYRTNVGIVNLSGASCTVRFQLVDEAGASIGNPRDLTADSRRWKQENDIFTKAGAGNRDVAYARVEVQTQGCTVWAYASVIDQATGDPTTIPVLLP